MSSTVIIRLGWFSPIRSAFFAVFFAGMGYVGAFLDTPGDASAEPDWVPLWIAAGVAAIFLLVMLRSLWLIFIGRPMATLSPEGLRARACDDVLIPWELVTSVTLNGEEASFSLSTSAAAPLMEALTRHDVYKVVLDPKVREIGVKHSDNLLTIGFKLAPFKLSLSSGAIAKAFRRHLPAERCVGFRHSNDPNSALDIAQRGALAAVAVAVGTMERMDAEQLPSNVSVETPPEPASTENAVASDPGSDAS